MRVGQGRDGDYGNKVGTVTPVPVLVDSSAEVEY